MSKSDDERLYVPQGVIDAINAIYRGETASKEDLDRVLK